jgi:cyclopropane fatty-acyl-phospholipid synthase-like methyltransferase
MAACSDCYERDCKGGDTRMKNYDSYFYETISSESSSSADVIVPLVLKYIHPKSVVDVGCGLGVWLSVFKNHGIEDIFGIDGDWINKNDLLIPDNCFMSFDLNKPLKLNKQFDLVVSLEVAEHLPKENADIFINSLTKLGNTILFSAAIPFQTGFNHVNEQWPEFWVEKFTCQGYRVIDCLRKQIWENDLVAKYYAQNILLFVKLSEIDTNEILAEEYKNTNVNILSLVHPKYYTKYYKAYNIALEEIRTIKKNHKIYFSIVNSILVPVNKAIKRILKIK